jgi:hypothetical protein
MQVTKLRASADATGLVPAGRYFEQLSKNLRVANARNVARRARDDAEDRAEEALRRPASVAAVNRARM